ncbi:MAG: hypothetical protein IPJ30_10015, partial [Acidobacteria bacterium]|nr:hypothetical protein [Acidobacteriota bacterium]
TGENIGQAINTALEMSPKYIPHPHLPDKATGWLDTASVKVEINEPVVGRQARTYHRGHFAGIANSKDMIYRDTSDRFSLMEEALADRVIGQRKRSSLGR